MLKIKELLKNLIKTQVNINDNLIKISKGLEQKENTYTIDKNKLIYCTSTVNSLSAQIETNIYTKQQTVETINKEYDYRKKYEECLEKNEPLLRLIENYCKYDDKYKVIDLFEKIDAEYDIKRKKVKE